MGGGSRDGKIKISCHDEQKHAVHVSCRICSRATKHICTATTRNSAQPKSSRREKVCNRKERRVRSRAMMINHSTKVANYICKTPSRTNMNELLGNSPKHDQGFTKVIDFSLRMAILAIYSIFPIKNALFQSYS